MRFMNSIRRRCSLLVRVQYSGVWSGITRSPSALIPAAMSRCGRRSYLSRVLDAHISSIQETSQMLESPADSCLNKVEWLEVIKLGEEVSKQATVAGMLWSGDAPDVNALEENMGAYFNVLHGFVLLCHGSTVGAGPTLHASINASVKQVIDCSIALLKEAVSTCESHNRKKRMSIPQLAGAVWEVCTALKKVPTTNCTAVGRAITQVAVSVKDVLREMGELKELSSAAGDGLEDATSKKDTDTAPISDDESSLTEADIGNDLSAEEMAIAQLVAGVVSETLAVIKELIRFISGLLKSSSLKINSKESTDSLEKILTYCQKMAVEVNELGACAYPPQEVYQMKSSMEKISGLVDKMRIEVVSLEGSPDGVFATFKRLESSLGNLRHGFGGDLVNEVKSLAL